MDNANYVAELNQLAQKKRWELRYEDVRCEGPDHIKTFTLRAVLNGQPYANGVGKNKKEAKKIAAKNALKGLVDLPPEQSQKAKDSPPSSVPPSPVQAPGITQYNYMCWLNEYGHKQRVSIRAVESTSIGSANSTMQCCMFVVDEKEYPKAFGATKKEAKEEAAKLVYHALYGSKTTETGDSLPNERKRDVCQGVSEIITPLRSLSTTTEDEGFTDTNFIGILNHYCQKKNLIHDYIFEKKTGLSHVPQFFYKAVIDNKHYPLAEGKSVKEAKQKAAQLAWAALQEQSDWDSKVSIRSSEDLPAHLNISSPAKIAAQNEDSNGQVRQASMSASLVFSDAIGSPNNQTPNPGVKPKRKIAANFERPCRSKEDVMPNLEIQSDGCQIEKTPPQAVNSRFLAEYECIQSLGKGGFGCVFKAKQNLLEKYFAIKIIRFREKALREVRALSDLSHVNIVRYYTCWIDDTDYQWDSSLDTYSSSQSSGSNGPQKFLYIQMELCDSKTLRVWIDEKNIQNVKKSRRDARRRDDSLKIAQQLITGVEYIHSKSLIHRDLKPANILFGREDVVKIGDFGLVTAESDDAENLIERTVYKGTPPYMAPEQKNRKTYDRKVDIFALGLIYFELLWNIETGHERQAIWEDLRGQNLPADFPHYFQQEGQMIKTMLSDQPQDRPEASKVKLDLEQFIQSRTELKNRRTV